MAERSVMFKKLPVMEIFGPTVQGEGLTAGQRTVFLRLGGCDYRCKMCDSMHAVDPLQIKEKATWMQQTEIFEALYDKLHEGNCEIVTISGGNPCIHDLSLLLQMLKNEGFKSALETQGTIAPDWLHMCNWVTISPKSPGMGEKYEPEKLKAFLKVRGAHNTCIKVVIFSAQDLAFASEVIDNVPWMNQQDGQFFLSLGNPYPPGSAALEEFVNDQEVSILKDQMPTTLSERLIDSYKQILEDINGFPALKRARFFPQLHVLLWGNAQGH